MTSLAGSFLIAKSKLHDPSFKKSVVLLLQHTSEGAFGLIVNRPAESKDLPFSVFFGGPCQAEGLLMLHGHAAWVEVNEKQARQAAPGVYVGDAASLQRVQDADAEEALRYRVFAGYAGWGPGQLEGELTEGAWALAAANGQLLFDTPVEELWERLLPPRLPEPSLN
jgi:putative transcriptional regulator